MKFFKLLITILFVFFLVGCNQYKETSIKEGENMPSTESIDDFAPNKEAVISAFKFWVNKNSWQYGDSTYLNKKKTIKIYYDRLSKENYYGYLYYPFKKEGKQVYHEFSFLISKTGFNTYGWSDETTNISKKLTYLGEDTFYFKSTEVSKPEYPSSSPIKNKFINMAKEEITNQISPPNPIGIGKYKVYIQNFTEEDPVVYAFIHGDNGEIFSCEIVAGYQNINENDGEIWQCRIKELEKKELGMATFFGFKDEGNWADEYDRNYLKKIMQISVCEFEVVVEHD